MSIRSIYDFVDRIVVVDGPYKGFSHNSLKSTDGTREFVASLDKVTLIDVDCPLIQPEKRNLYFDDGADWYFWIDGDEIAFGDLESAFNRIHSLSPKRYRCLTVSVFETVGINERIRFFSREFKPKYEERHYKVVDHIGRLFTATPGSDDYTYIPHLYLANLNKFRNSTRKAQMQEYRQSKWYR